jgi:hypothetical protein
MGDRCTPAPRNAESNAVRSSALTVAGADTTSRHLRTPASEMAVSITSAAALTSLTTPPRIAAGRPRRPRVARSTRTGSLGVPTRTKAVPTSTAANGGRDLRKNKPIDTTTPCALTNVQTGSCVDARRSHVVWSSENGPVVLSAVSVDCEQLRDGLVAQPANTLSSLAFVVAGICIVMQARRDVINRDGIVVGVAAVATGIGSAAFHSANTTPAHWLHDTTLVTVFALVAIRHLGRKRVSLARVAPFVAAASGATVLVLPNATTLVTALLAGGVVVSELVERRRTTPVVDAPLVAMMAVGLSASWLGRRGSPLCAPASMLQPHALWHVVMAVSCVWWCRRAILRAPLPDSQARAVRFARARPRVGFRRSSRMSTRGKPSSAESVGAAYVNPACSNIERVPT